MQTTASAHRVYPKVLLRLYDLYPYGLLYNAYGLWTRVFFYVPSDCRRLLGNIIYTSPVTPVSEGSACQTSAKK